MFWLRSSWSCPLGVMCAGAMKDAAHSAGPPWGQQNKGEAADKQVISFKCHGLNAGEHTLWG